MRKLGSLVLRRIALGLVTLFAVSLILFAALNALPGDAAEEMLGQDATPEAVENLRRDLGLDRPAPERYITWIVNIAKGNLGRSIATKREIGDLLAPRIKNTLFLACFAAILSIPLALALGAFAAVRRGGMFDGIVNYASLICLSLPEFLLGYILLLYLSVNFPIFPSISNVTPDDELIARVYQTVLPAVTLSLVIVAYMTRMVRASIIAVLSSPYIEMARLKGLSNVRITLVHALPNAIAPIVNVISLSLAHLVVGVVIVEVVFVYPGVGQLLVDSVSRRDITVVQSCALFFALTYIILNLVADVVSIVSNPRLLHPR
jgi:peptide/nickel transport system permease protein